MQGRLRIYFAFIFIPLLWAGLASAADSSFLSITNADRAAVAVAPLAYNTALGNAAAAKLADMQAKNYWAHVSPEGHDAGYFIDAQGYQWVGWAENLAEGYTTSGAVVAAWMNSSGHKTNMLNASYREVGYAMGMGTVNGQTAMLAVAIYGSTIRGATAPLATPKPATPSPKAMVAITPAPTTIPAVTPTALPTATPAASPSPVPTAAPTKHPTATPNSDTSNLTKGVKSNDPADRLVGILAVFFIIFGSLGLLFMHLLPRFTEGRRS